MTNNNRQAKGDKLLVRVLSGDEWASGIVNDLLNEFHRGYPIENLVKLLHSDNEKVVQSGIWIASELARNARPILPDLLPFFDYPNPRVKCEVIETTLTAATDEDGEITARAVTLVTDVDQRVRRRSFELLTRAGLPVLAASVPCIANSEIAALLDWVLEVEDGSRDRDEIASRLQVAGGLKLLFAVIAAARVYTRNPEHLKSAVSLSEDDTRSLANSELEWLVKLQEQTQRRRERAERKNR